MKKTTIVSFLFIILVLGCFLLCAPVFAAYVNLTYTCSGITQPTLVYVNYTINSFYSSEVYLGSNRNSYFFPDYAIFTFTTAIGILSYTSSSGTGTIYVRAPYLPTLSFIDCVVVAGGGETAMDSETVSFLVGALVVVSLALAFSARTF